MAQQLFNRSDRRKVTLFFTCVAISLFTWLFYSLSGTYEYVTETAVHYINSPGNKAFHPLQPDTVGVRIAGTGWQLLFDKLRIKPAAIQADLRGLGSKNFIVFSEQLTDVNKQIRSSQKIVAVIPDTLYFDFSPRSVKQVPVRFVHQLKFNQQFGISSAIQLHPDHITITGPASELSKINFWPTDSLSMNKIAHTFTVQVPLSDNSSPNIDVFPPSITARVPVDEFTEKTIEIPVTLINRNNYRVKVLPSSVKVKLLAPLSGFHNAEWDKIKAVVDLNSWITRQYSQLPVRLVNVPAYGKVISIEPQAIDFMVRN